MVVRPAFFAREEIDGILTRFRGRAASFASMADTEIASFLVAFAAFAFALAMATAFISLIFLRLSFNFACLAL